MGGRWGELALGECLCELCVLAVLFFSVIAEGVGRQGEGGELALGEMKEKNAMLSIMLSLLLEKAR